MFELEIREPILTCIINTNNIHGIACIINTVLLVLQEAELPALLVAQAGESYLKKG